MEIKDFYLTKEVFRKQRFFLDQESFPQAKFFFDQRSFPQAKIYSRSRKFPRIKGIFLNPGSLLQSRKFSAIEKIVHNQEKFS